MISRKIAILLGVVAAGPLHGQGLRVEPGISLGASFPIGDFQRNGFGEGFRVGWWRTALVNFQTPHGRFGFRAEGSFGANGSNAQLTSELSMTNRGTSATTKLLGGTADITYNLALPASVIVDYLTGGVGVYGIKLCLNGAFTGCRSATKVGWNVGGGLLHRVGRRSAWFVEVRYFNLGAADLYGLSIKPRSLSVTAGVQLLKSIGTL